MEKHGPGVMCIRNMYTYNVNITYIYAYRLFHGFTNLNSRSAVSGFEGRPIIHQKPKPWIGFYTFQHIRPWDINHQSPTIEIMGVSLESTSKTGLDKSQKKTWFVQNQFNPPPQTTCGLRSFLCKNGTQINWLITKPTQRG